jgi:hypothetical protein
MFPYALDSPRLGSPALEDEAGIGAVHMRRFESEARLCGRCNEMMAPSNGFEPLTLRLTGGCSTRLSYDGTYGFAGAVKVTI